MKKSTVINFVVLLCVLNIFAQTEELKYRRSSLSMVLIESDEFPNKESVSNSWENYPFPEKYNQHNINSKAININAIKLSDQDLLNAGYLKDTLNNVLKITKAETLGKVRYLNSDKSLALALPTEKKEYQLKLDKFIKEQGIAKQMVASWFNKSASGKFDMTLIQERGFYNASEMEATIASGQARGLASLGDAGEELIKNTFITFTKLNFISNEPAARVVRDAAKKTLAENSGSKPAFLIKKLNKGIDKIYNKTKEGYTIMSKTWLYSLKWDDTIANTFYSELWNNPEAFDKSDIFNLQFVGVQYNSSLVTFKLGEKRTEAQIIDLALVRNLDNAFTKLQKKNEVFMPSIPVASVNPIMAKIGKKEGLKGGEKFEVFEMVWNEKEGKTSWKSVGKCSVDKKGEVWDNRYAANQTSEPQKDKKGNLVTATSFKGSDKIQVGMLLKQLK